MLVLEVVFYIYQFFGEFVEVLVSFGVVVYVQLVCQDCFVCLVRLGVVVLQYFGGYWQFLCGEEVQGEVVYVGGVQCGGEGVVQVGVVFVWVQQCGVVVVEQEFDYVVVL